MEPIDILLIEDNEGDIFLTAEGLRESDVAHKLRVIKDGCEALNFLEQKGVHSERGLPDLILLDINLPKVNGHEILRRIKSNEELRHLPVIVLSTSSSKEDIISCYRNFASCYISKPMDAGKFQKVISGIQDFWGTLVELPKN